MLTSNSANTANSTHPQIFMKRPSVNFKRQNTYNASHYSILYILYYSLNILYYTMMDYKYVLL